MTKEERESNRELLEKLKLTEKTLSKVKATGRIVIKLCPFSKFENSIYDIELQDKDTIFLPKKPNTVTVVGQVYSPNAIIFDPKHRKVKYYLEKTGGITEYADRDHIFIVRADGTVISQSQLKEQGFWLMSRARNIENCELFPGDAVIVPEKIKFPHIMRDIKDITTIIYQIAVAVAVLNTL